MVVTTTCYIRKDNQILLLLRNKKENDINENKWIGVGGKVELGESPDDCIVREIKEETGLTAQTVVCHGFVTFPGLYYGDDELMFVYTCDDFSGELINCDEGELHWIDKDKISLLPMWEADYHYLEWINDNKFHSAKTTYKDNKLISYIEYKSISHQG